ncbi:ATPase [Salpingoeca rosetta]|uniref:P-type Cu(+) transporter n=1 Tax=Salpingoeca rosetta (strain ATCC 50818 / BSB-021) TaxID=946362 RepID=F2TY74_SALR5|nr:ATPase [Salpingoeca rosetta]EGD76333.1 ATPase [Salpingoeca rosetta]|eukprot:XP_004998508.1 ATPase [Salpingoeca rosetta]
MTDQHDNASTNGGQPPSVHIHDESVDMRTDSYRLAMTHAQEPSFPVPHIIAEDPSQRRKRKKKKRLQQGRSTESQSPDGSQDSDQETSLAQSSPGLLKVPQDDSVESTQARALTASQRSAQMKKSLQRSLLRSTALEKKKRKQKGKPDLEDLKREVVMDDHAIPLHELQRRLGITDVSQGLSTEQVEAIRGREGLNVLSPPPTTLEWIKFLRQMVGGFATLLWIGAILCFIAYGIQVSQADPGVRVPADNLYLGIVLAVVVFVTGCFSYMQERRAADVMKSFIKLQPQKSRVHRNGKLEVLNAEELVRGDVVEVKAGDRIPADLRIIDEHGLKVDNSSLTGEAEPQSRSAECTSDTPLETKNIAFFSTNAVEGAGTGIVIRCGDNTVLGRIAGLASGVDSGDTPIAREIQHFINIISTVAVFLGITFFAVSLGTGYFWLDSVIFLIGIIVANVPEGLLATVTVCLTLTAKKMATKNCLVKHLEAVETLGSTSTICSDKTGTLTQNNMTVAHVCFDQQIREVNTDPDVEKDLPFAVNTSFRALFRVAVLCNKARFRAGNGPNKTDSTKHHRNGDANSDLPILLRSTVGDASECAIFKFTERCAQTVLDDPVLTDESIVVAERKKYPIVAEIPFNSKNKYQVSVHTTPDNDPRYLLVMKGAPERIFVRCSHIYRNGNIEPLTDDDRRTFDANCLQLGKYGERVLGFATLRLPLETYPTGFDFGKQSENVPLDDLVYCGLLALIDPPRPTVPAAVAKCRSAGIKVIMVTGDHPITAQAIAKQVGIIHSEKTADDIAEERGVDVSSVDPAEAGAIVIKVRVISVRNWIDHMHAHCREVLIYRLLTPSTTGTQNALTLLHSLSHTFTHICLLLVLCCPCPYLLPQLLVVAGRVGAGPHERGRP